jgi:hypothetical protein
MKKIIVLNISFVESEGEISHTVNYQIVENDVVVYKGDIAVSCVDIGSSKEEYDFNLKSKLRETVKGLGYIVNSGNIILLN